MTKIKLFGMIVAALHLTTTVHAVNYKILNSEAEAYTSRILSRIPATEEQVRETLSYSILRPGEGVEEKYTSPDSFPIFYEALITEIGDDYFKDFAGICRGLYMAYDKDNAKQLSVHLLLEAVKGKYDEIQDRLNKRRKAKVESIRALPGTVGSQSKGANLLKKLAAKRRQAGTPDPFRVTATREAGSAEVSKEAAVDRGPMPMRASAPTPARAPMGFDSPIVEQTFFGGYVSGVSALQ